MEKRFAKISQKAMADALADDVKREQFLFLGLNVLLAAVAFFMSAVNLATEQYVLMGATLTFGVFSLANIVLCALEKFRVVTYVLFGFEIFALFAFFIITGNPDGFSVLWVSLVPSFALLIFGYKRGSIFCLVTFLVLIFFFWTPLGHSILQYPYNSTFMLRFPFFFMAIYVISLFIETIRATIQKKLIESDERNRYLYRHDNLTGLRNRYGFYEAIKDVYLMDSVQTYAAYMFDIDNFKKINDTLGHAAGDVILRDVAKVITENTCDKSIYCRWGGEEFLAFTYCDHDCGESAERIRSAIEQHSFTFEGRVIPVTVSGGVCTSHVLNPDILEQMTRVADECLYQAKHSGKNQIKVTHLEQAVEAPEFSSFGQTHSGAGYKQVEK